MNSLVQRGAMTMGLAVALGAFGAHAIANSVSPERLDVWKTAVLYQAVHGLAIILAGICGSIYKSPKFNTAGSLFLAGTTVFSGSLYALVLLDKGILGAVTPLGGLMLITGWAIFALGASQTSKSPTDDE
jgi:uncharacterized membrane protein YgdD (TMEM256/DUF423 family)